MDAPLLIHVHSSSILPWYVEDQIWTNFHVFSTYFFDVIAMAKKSRCFPCTFSNVILMIKKSTLFRQVFFDVISMAEKCTSFRCTFVRVILLLKKSTLFKRTYFDTKSLVEISMLYLHVSTQFFRRFCKLMKTADEVFLCL